MQYPKISIVTPSYNQAPFLEATIQSILSQNYPNLEYIIIDGGSSDGSQEIIKKYEPYLHYWCSEPDAGQYDAINKGFSKSTGEIMAWLNSDDMYCSWTLKTVASIMTSLPQIKWLTTLMPAHWDWEGLAINFETFPGYSQAAFLDGRYLPVPKTRASIGYIQQESTFWNRSLWEKAGSYISTEYKLASDFELWARFYLHAELYSTLSPLAGFRCQSNQRSVRQENLYISEAKEILEKMRSQVNWKQNKLRDRAIKFRLFKIPKVRELVKSSLSYEGKLVVKKDLRDPDSYWAIEEQRFLCRQYNGWS